MAVSILSNSAFIFPFIILSTCVAYSLSEHGKRVYRKHDLMVTFATSLDTLTLVEASRAWRNGVRAHFVVGSDVDLQTLQALGRHHNETFTALPAFPGHPSTTSFVLSPLFAAAAAEPSGGFKWLLVGDADTLFAVPAVLRLLNRLGLDSDEPHALTDFLIDCPPCGEPVCICEVIRDDPRCLPCPRGPAVCPCRLPEKCTDPQDWSRRRTPPAENTTRSNSSKTKSTTTPTNATISAVFRSGCPVTSEISSYGGAGLILSAGLVRRLTTQSDYLSNTFEVVRTETPYGDIALAELQRRAGYGFTRLPLPPGPFPPSASSASASSSSFSTEPTPNLPARRWFGSFSTYNDHRSLREQLRDLVGAKLEDPGALAAVVSHHLRPQGDRMDLANRVLPAYRAVSSLLSRAQKD